MFEKLTLEDKIFCLNLITYDITKENIIELRRTPGSIIIITSKHIIEEPYNKNNGIVDSGKLLFSLNLKDIISRLETEKTKIQKLLEEL